MSRLQKWLPFYLSPDVLELLTLNGWVKPVLFEWNKSISMYA